MDASTFVVTLRDFQIFHEIDRKLYSILTMNLWRDHVQSMKVMALWFCLEQCGFYNVIMKVLSLPEVLIDDLVDEAVTCLNYLTASCFLSFSKPINIPLTKTVIGNKFSPQYFDENRKNVNQKMNRLMSEVYAWQMTDIIKEAKEKHDVYCQAEAEILMSSFTEHGSLDFRTGATDKIRPGDEAHEVHPDDRTLFITFSRGHSVAEAHIRDFFTRTSGTA